MSDSRSASSSFESTPGSSQFKLLDELAEEFAARFRQGERPTIEEYTDRYPDLADEIRDLFPALVEIQCADLERSAQGDPSRSRSTRTAPLPGQVGDFRIVREIGRGGMGIVYQADQVTLGRMVALKVLPRDASPASAERFRREARAAAKLHHTNIVPVFEVGQDGDTSFYAMQFIQGCALDLVIHELRRIRKGPGASANRFALIATAQGAEKAPRPAPMGTRPRSAGPTAGVLARSLAANERTANNVSQIALSVITGQFAPVAIEESAVPTRPSAVSLADGEKTVADVTDPVNSAGCLELAAPAGANFEAAVEAPAASPSSSNVKLPGGKSLSDHESGERTFYLSVARIGRQVAGALAHAHERGVIHRDIKPSNLLLDADGTVWITDFGLAKADEDGLTGTGDILGTLRYMAPERFRGESDGRSDIYALGLTLHELLTLGPAFAASDRLELIAQIKNDEPARPRAVDAKIPRDLETIVLKAIEKDPKRRYASPVDFGEDLRRFIDGEPIRARRVSDLERVWMLARRHRMIASLLAFSVLALLCGTVSSTLFGLHARERAAAARKAEIAAKDNLEQAESARLQASRELERAKRAEAEAHAVIQFLQDDVLSQASPKGQQIARPDVVPDPNLSVRKLLDQATERIEARFPNQPLVEATIRETIGTAYLDIGEFDKGERNLRRALDLRRQRQPEDALEVLSVMVQLGYLYHLKGGAYSEAVAMEARALELSRKSLGEDHPVTIKAMGYLVWIYAQWGYHVPGLPLAKEYLETSRRLFGEDSRDTAAALLSLGLLRLNEGKYSEAEKLFRESTEIRGRMPGNDELGRARVARYLAQSFYRQGKYPETERILTDILPVYHKMMGKGHVQVLRIVTDLGQVYYGQQKYAQAASLMEGALLECRNTGNQTHAFVLQAQLLLGQIYQTQKKYASAENLYKSILERLRQKAEPDVWAVYSLANVYLAQGKRTEARAILADELRRSESDARHDRAAMDRADSLAGYLCAFSRSSGLCDPAAAVRLGKRVVAAFPAVASYWSNLSIAHYMAGNWKEAIQAAEKVLELQKTASTAPDVLTEITAKNSLASDLSLAPESSGLRDPVRAVALGKEIVAAQPNNAGFWNTLGTAQYRLGDWQEAVRSLEKSMSLRRGGTFFDWVFLAMAHWKLGHEIQARHWFRKAISGAEQMQDVPGAPDQSTIQDICTEADALITTPAFLPEDVFAH